MEQLETLGSRLKQLQAHDVLCLLQNALAIPKVLYILRTAPSSRSPVLASFDCVLRSLLESICNIHLSDQSLTQALLPINLGGLGIRSATMLAPSAFLASAAGTSSIIPVLLPPTSLPVTCPTKRRHLISGKPVMAPKIHPPEQRQASKGHGIDQSLMLVPPASLCQGSPVGFSACLA